MARRTVFTSNFNRRAISFFGTLSTRCKCRTSAHWVILITSASSQLNRRDDLSRPVDHRQGTLFPSAQGVPFQVATGSLFMLPLPAHEVELTCRLGTPEMAGFAVSTNGRI